MALRISGIVFSALSGLHLLAWTTSTGGYYRWLPQLKRVLDMADNQVRALRRQDLIRRFMAADDPDLRLLPAGSRLRRQFSMPGTYWGVATDPAHYRADPGNLVQPRWQRLAGIGTRLHFLGESETVDLVNWGYLVSDLALRSYGDMDVVRLKDATKIGLVRLAFT